MLQIMDSPGLSEQLKYKMKVSFWKIETSQSKCGENGHLNVLILQKIAHLNIYIRIYLTVSSIKKKVMYLWRTVCLVLFSLLFLKCDGGGWTRSSLAWHPSQPLESLQSRLSRLRLPNHIVHGDLKILCVWTQQKLFLTSSLPLARNQTRAITSITHANKHQRIPPPVSLFNQLSTCFSVRLQVIY